MEPEGSLPYLQKPDIYIYIYILKFPVRLIYLIRVQISNTVGWTRINTKVSVKLERMMPETFQTRSILLFLIRIQIMSVQ
jgi:hypothetical protein